MISLTFVVLAAICNAIMDVSLFHYYYSILTKLSSRWWNGANSWANKYIDNDPSKGRRKCFFGLLNLPVQFTDSFHLFKSLMIVFMMCAIAFAPKNIFGIENWIFYSVIIIIFGTAWNLTFNLFYNKILRKK